MNQVFLIGRLGADPETSYTQNGNSVCKFSVATNETYRDKSGVPKQTEPVWHNIECWNNLAENCSSLKKGDEVFIDGTLKMQQWKTKTSEIKQKIIISPKIVRKTDLVLKEIPPQKEEQVNTFTLSYTTDDIPF